MTGAVSTEGVHRGCSGAFNNDKRTVGVAADRRECDALPALANALMIALAIAPALSGCAVGPNFKSPPPPATDAYSAEALPVQTESTGVAGGEAQRFQFGRDLPGQWWALFGSNQLNALIEEAMANYPSIAAQQAALRAARENVRAEEGAFLPQIGGAASYTREKVSGATIAPGSAHVAGAVRGSKSGQLLALNWPRPGAAL